MIKETVWIKEEEGGKKRDRENVGSVSSELRNFKVFLFLNLCPSDMQTDLLWGGEGCQRYIMQAIYQNPFIQHGAVIKYSCFSLHTHPDTHTLTHAHKGIHFSFSLLKKRRNLHSMLPLTRLGHFPWRPAPLEVTVKRELGKKQHVVDGFA